LLAVASAWLSLPQPLTLTTILSWAFYPVTALLGIPLADVATAARLLGERVILTEVVSYQEMARLASAGGFVEPRTVVIVSRPGAAAVLPLPTTYVSVFSPDDPAVLPLPATKVVVSMPGVAPVLLLPITIA
jgi:hypothetical protein